MYDVIADHKEADAKELMLNLVLIFLRVFDCRRSIQSILLVQSIVHGGFSMPEAKSLIFLV